MRSLPEKDEKRRLVEAFTRLAAESGLRNVTGVTTATVAGLPQHAFAEHFSSPLGCLVAAHDAFFERLHDDVAEAAREEIGWAAQVRRAISTCLECLADVESRARLFAVEAAAAGPAILERRFTHTARIAEYLRDGRRHYPEAEPLAEDVEWTLVAGVLARVTSYLLAEQGSLLPQLEAELTEFVLLPYLGAEQAKHVAAGAQLQSSSRQA